MRSQPSRPSPPGAATLVAILFLALLLEGRAYAYLDPGSISLFFQALIAGIFGGLLVLKRYCRRFGSKPQDDES